MAAQIRQEINILDHALSSALTPSVASSNERYSVDPSQYNGTVSYYLEVVAINNDSSARTVSANDWIGGPSVSITAGTSAYTIFRSSAAGTPPVAGTSYGLTVNGTTSAGQLIVKSARIVVIQEATTLTNTETQIEIGNYNTGRTAESATILTNPKYWKYDASKWDGTKTFYAEAVYDSGDMDTITVGIYESTAIDAPSWSLNATIVSAATTTTPTRTRVAFTPVDGRWYTIFSLNGSMDNHDIYRAGVVVQQTDIAQLSDDGSISYNIQGGNAAGTEQAAASVVIPNATETYSSVKLKLKKVGSPTDTLTVDIVSSLGGSSLATATLSASTLTTSYVVTTLTFVSPISLTGGSTYYLQVTRTPDNNDTTNYVVVAGTQSNISPTWDNSSYERINGTWTLNSPSSSASMYLELIGTGITKLEPQYLLANTLFAAGTALQTFLTDWDSTEWDDGAGSITYYFQAEAANGSTSDVTLQEADGGGTVTNSTLTNIDNAQISAAMTMPADQNLDVIANANAGDVAAARILVTYVFSAAAPEPPYVPPVTRFTRRIIGPAITRAVILFLTGVYNLFK